MSNRRSTGTGGFVAAIAVAAALAISFLGFLYWHSQQMDQEATSMPEPKASAAPVRSEPSPTPSTPIAASAHPLDAGERLPLGGTSAVRYVPKDGAVAFAFEVAANEWPSIDVDVNQNGAVDANVDRSYTIATDGNFCPQYLLSPNSWSNCGGAPSSGRASVSGSRRNRMRVVTLTIPAEELSTDLDAAHLAFKLCRRASGSWECSQSPGGSGVAADFTEMFSIRLR